MFWQDKNIICSDNYLPQNNNADSYLGGMETASGLTEQCLRTLDGVTEPKEEDATQMIAEPAPRPSFPIHSGQQDLRNRGRKKKFYFHIKININILTCILHKHFAQPRRTADMHTYIEK